MALLGLSHCLLHVRGKVKIQSWEITDKTKRSATGTKKITVRTSTKHNDKHPTKIRISALDCYYVNSTWGNEKTVTFLTQQARHGVPLYPQQLTTAQTHNNFPEGSQNSKYTQSIRLDPLPNSAPTIIHWNPDSTKKPLWPLQTSYYTLLNEWKNMRDS